MALTTLTQTSLFSRKASRWLIAAIIVVVSLVVLLGLGKSLFDMFSPPGSTPATVAFGKLPVLDLSEGIMLASGINYTIDTISGDLPKLPGNAKVFGIAQREVAFGDLEKFKGRAAGAGYSNEPTEVTGDVVKFISPSDSDRVLIFERLSDNFTLKSDFSSNVQIISSRPQSIVAATSTAESFFRILGVKLQDFPLDKIVVRKLRIDGNSLTATPSLSNANLIEVTFVRGDLDKLAVIWPRNDAPGVVALVAENGVVAATFDVSHVQKYRFSTYPLKGTERAYEELKAGLGAFNEEPTGNNFSIIDVSLGYVESRKSKKNFSSNKQSFSTNQEYLQPFYLFKGLNDVIAYVGAVDDAFIVK